MIFMPGAKPDSGFMRAFNFFPSTAYSSPLPACLSIMLKVYAIVNAHFGLAMSPGADAMAELFRVKVNILE